MNRNLLGVLIFLLVVVGLFCIVPNHKVETIGDFFEKIVKPLSWPLSAIILGWLGFDKYKKLRQNKKEESPENND
jgi:uncharacterized protein YggT (Ycf19 family)